MQITKNLKELAQIFKANNSTLYVVGGKIRNFLMQESGTDIDVCGSLLPEEVQEILEQKGFRCQIINKRLGTILISCKNNEQFEYTTFRQENYGNNGNHTPMEVNFCKDVKLDATRRDFTINALYYDVLQDKIIDFFNGITDCENRILKTVLEPEIVFNSDGLRILRMIRFLCRYNLKADKKTYKTAKNLSYKIKDISKERILQEIKLTNVSECNNKTKLLVKHYNKLKVWKYIFNGYFKNGKIENRGKFYNAYLKSNNENVELSLMCLILKSYFKTTTTYENVVFVTNVLFGSCGLKETSKNINKTIEVYYFLQNLIFNKIKITNRQCIQYSKFDESVKNYINLFNLKMIKKLKLQVDYMKSKNIPFNENELQITNDKFLIDDNFDKKNISKIKTILFELCVDELIENKFDVLMEQAKQINMHLKNSKQ